MAGEERRDPRISWMHDGNMLLEGVRECKEAVNNMADEMKEVRQVDIPGLRVEIAKLTVKAGIWGAIAGAIPVGIGMLVGWLKGH